LPSLPVSPPGLVELARRLDLPPDAVPLLREALTHRSALPQQRRSGPEAAPPPGERLEFLGDAVLDLIVAEHAFRTYEHLSEGHLTRLKARWVSRPSLAAAALALGLGELLELGPGEEAAGGRERPSILCDAFEAVLAVVYLAHGGGTGAAGLSAAREVVRWALFSQVDPGAERDAKTRLQEYCQAQYGATPEYESQQVGGPAHRPHFHSRAVLGGRLLGEGEGATKKAAEQAAAAAALKTLVAREPSG
jgi:ribonuclease-3